MTTKEKLKNVLVKEEEFIRKMDEPQFIDLYNQSLTHDGIVGTIHTRISDGNYWFVLEVENESET